MSFKPREGNLAQSLGGYLWAVSSLVGGEDANQMPPGNPYRTDKAPSTGHTRG